MDIVLINPTSRSFSGSYGESEKGRQYMLPYSVFYLQNYLARQGVKSTMFDLFVDKPADLYSHCRSLQKPLIGVTSQNTNRFEAIEVIDKLKRINPGSILVAGGKQFGETAEEALLHVPAIDVIVRGEGEITLHELYRTLESGGDLSGVAGITYRDMGEIRRNPARPPAVDISPFAIDYQHVRADLFGKGIVFRNFQNENLRALPVQISRGCPQRCAFCTYNLMRYRVRHLDDVFREIRYLMQQFGTRHFHFADPSFTERRRFVEEFCQELLQGQYGIKWICEARADTDPELLEIMAKAGCISLDFGLESGSEKVLKAIQKRINIPDTIKFAQTCKRLGIRALVFVMVSLPEEKEDDAKQTLELLRQLSEYTKYCTINVTAIQPGTAVEARARNLGLLPRNFSWYDDTFANPYPDLGGKTMPLYLEHLSPDFIRWFLKEAQKIQGEKYTTWTDLTRSVRNGVRRALRQPIRETVKDVKRFGRMVRSRPWRN